MNDIITHVIVPSDHPSLAGHFPDRPIVPGVVLLDTVLAAIRSAAGESLRLGAIVSSKFLQAVDPGMRIELQIKFTAQDAARWKARFSATHSGTPVFEGSFLLTNSPLRDGTT